MMSNSMFVKGDSETNPRFGSVTLGPGMDFIRRPALVDAGLVADAETTLDAAVGGQRIGSYEIIRELGRGGTGTVHLATRAPGSSVSGG
jgi:hypothetical protein